MQDLPERAPQAQQRARKAAAERLDWPDAARGMTVLLVVAMHILFLQMVPLLWDSPGRQVVHPIISATTIFRMPLFFVISGFLSAGMLQRSWRTGFSGRVAPRYYLYVVWLAITTLVVWWLYAIDDVPFEPLDYFVPQLWEPAGILWYIWALAVYFLVARATRAVPLWILIPIAAGASLLPEYVDLGAYYQIVPGFLPFLVGARMAPQIRALADRSPLWLGIGLAAVAVGADLLHDAIPAEHTVRRAAVMLVGGFVAVAAILSLLPRTAGMAVWRPIRHVGRHTLAIFAMHPLLILIANALLRDQTELLAWANGSRWSWFWMPVELLAIVLISLGFERLCRAIGLRHLFEMPRWRTLRRSARERRARAARRQSSSET